MSRFSSLYRCLIAGLLTLLPAQIASAQYGPPIGDTDYDDANAHIFLQDEVTFIDVTMDPADLQFIIDNTESDEYKMCEVHIYNSMIDEVYAEVGIRARGNVARSNMKFPWKLSFNTFQPGRKIHGLKKINLGSDSGDPSLSRSRLVYKAFNAMGVPSSRTHYVRLKINDGAKVEGVYIHLEQVDDEFVQAWYGSDLGDLYKCRNKSTNGADLRFISPGTPDVYRALGNQRGRTYEDETNDDNLIALADFINFVNNASDEQFEAEIADRLAVDGFLRAMAVDVTAGQWDGYWFGANNYYLFQNLEADGRFEYIPWDLCNSMGMDFWFIPVFGGQDWTKREFDGWGNGGFGGGIFNVPVLVRRILDIPIYRDAMLGYVHECVSGPFSISTLEDTMVTSQKILDPYIFQGSFQGNTMDNGFRIGDFRRAFDNPRNYAAFAGATWGLRPFLEERQNYVLYREEEPIPRQRIFINEVVSDNETIIQDEAGQFEDYVEIYNDESVEIDLSGAYLSDYAGNPIKWQFPAGTIVPAKGHIIVWCDEDPDDGPLHANFKLSNAGEGVCLFANDLNRNVLLDRMIFPALADDIAYGRTPDGSLQIAELDSPTPGASNNGGGFSLVADRPCPGPNSFYATGGTPNTDIAFIAASGAGSTFIQSGPVCVGTELGLSGSLTLVDVVTSDSTGTAVLNFDIPTFICGIAHLQALDTSNCDTTNVIVP